ncbi:hypothetical protein ACF07U_33835 [Streptomyces californicus]|uniref:hypothetical protein n=1 Tax=Streptomyces californicus TaxID=67351 RepID=UPI0036FE1BED
MRQEWSPEDVVTCWTLVDGDGDLVADKTGPTRLGFCLMLKFFELEGRFPEFTALFWSRPGPGGAKVSPVPTDRCLYRPRTTGTADTGKHGLER